MKRIPHIRSGLVRVTDLRTGRTKTFFPWEPRDDRKRWARSQRVLQTRVAGPTVEDGPVPELVYRGVQLLTGRV